MAKGRYIRSAITKSKLIYFVVILLVAVGAYGIYALNKDEFPTFEIREGLVVGVYPGASSEEVETQLTKPLEDILFSYQEVERETYSYSRNGYCFIFVDVANNVDKDSFWSKIKLRLASEKRNLPPGVLAVEVLDEFSSISSVLVSLESDDKGYSEMKEIADELCDRLREIPNLANARLYGTRDEEIAVHLDMQKLSRYGISSEMLLAEYGSATALIPGGTFKSGYIDAPIIVGNTVGSEMEVSEKIIYSDPEGNVVRLRDVASIERRIAPPSSFVESDGKSAIIISVEMRPDNDIVKFGREVDKVLASFGETLPPSVHVEKITDQPQVVGHSVWSFLRDLVISMLAVIFVMMMLFPWRSAVIASSGVPVCTAVTLGAMFVLGITLNTVTLAALIVVLGMIVDDSIITIDGYIVRLGKGQSPLDAAATSGAELFVPMFIATLAICLMFFPMLGIIDGYLGDFIKMFPIVVLVALTASLVYAVTVVPSMEVSLIPNVNVQKENFFTRGQNAFFRILQDGYEKMETFCFSHPAVIMLTGVVVIGLGIFMLLQLNIQMMPMAERELFVVEVHMDAGGTLEETREVADSLSKLYLSDKRVKTVTSFIGTGAPRFHATYAPAVPSSQFAQLIVCTVSNESTKAIIKETEKVYENRFPNALVRVKQMDYQAVPAQVGVRFTGDDRQAIVALSDSLKNYLYGIKGLKWVHSDSDEYDPVVKVTPDADEAARLGVNRAMIALSLAGSFNGLPVATLWEGTKPIPVRIYSDAVCDDMDYDVVASQIIPTAIPGVSVRLDQVATVEPDWAPHSITRVGGRHTSTVYADLVFGYSQPPIMKKVGKFLDNLDIPDGVEMNVVGLKEINSIYVPKIMWSFICAVAVLFFFLLFHFKKISLAILTIVLSSICMFGAFFGLWLFNLDFTITAVLGLISIVGIIVRNGIVMFEYAEYLRFEKGLSLRDAAFEAGRRRMRPIFLTSCTTALGVLPMILAADPLWMPLGVVICFGTMLSILMIVLIMPVSYWQVYRVFSSKKKEQV